MKFQCDRCKTRYSIADEKVRGKVLKIRCKSCEAIITVRDAAIGSEPPRLSAQPVAGSGPSPVVSASGGRAQARVATNTIQLSMSSPAMLAAAAPLPGERPAEAEEWFLSLDGKQEGPFSAEEAQRRVAALAAGAEMFAWRDDFEEWLPVAEVPVLAVHLPRHARPVSASHAVVASLPVAPPAEEPPPPADPFAGVPGAAAAAPPEAPPPHEDNFDFNIGEASRLVKLPILPPPQQAGPRPSESLPGISAPAPAAGTSLQLPIASLSTEMEPVKPPPAAPSTNPAPRARRRVSIPILVAGGATLVLVALIGLFYGQDPPDTRPPSAAPAPDSVLVTNFYSKDNPLFGREPRPEKPAAEPVMEIAPPQAPPPSVDEKARLRQRRTAEPEVRPDPVTRPSPPRMTSPRGKTDSFDGEGAAPGGPLTPDDVRDTYAANEVGLKRCYERSLKADPTSNVNKMVVKITITPAGNVSEIDVPDRQTELGSCVANSIKGWQFRRSTGEFTTEFTVFFAKR
jgi:predicted Zn finger-like uncharacterized protein